jgi:peptide/nickel transport system permease protein
VLATLRAAAANPWVRFSARRVVSLVVALVLLCIAIFASVRLIPGDPIAGIVGITATPEQRLALRQQMGLDKPAFSQFWSYLNDLLHGRLGTSFQTGSPVSQVLAERIGPSLELAASSLAITLVVGIPLGIAVGLVTENGRRRRLDLTYQTVTQIAATLPELLFATALAFVFAVKLNWLPVAGGDGMQALVLPVAALTLPSVAGLSRFVRVETLNVLGQDYIRTARAARLPHRIILFRHVLPNVITAALTIGGLIFAGVIGGAVIVENVFNRPGLGTAITTALAARDYPVIQGLTLALGAIVVIVNSIVDVVLATVDKRTLVRFT